MNRAREVVVRCRTDEEGYQSSWLRSCEGAGYDMAIEMLMRALKVTMVRFPKSHHEISKNGSKKARETRWLAVGSRR